MEQSNLQNLLSQINTLVRKNEEIINATGARFNIFRTLNVAHYENTHSTILAEFLNPKSTHGLKEKLLESFCEIIKDSNKEDFNFDCKNASVKTEAYAGEYGRIDILIENNQNQAIIIENKIYANDQYEQLIRYNTYAKSKNYSNYLILYLTLDGCKASSHSGNDVKYYCISYQKDIINWLKKCLSHSSNHPYVHETIHQYINHLKQLTGQDMDIKNSQEIAALLAKKENIDAAVSIFNNMNTWKVEIIKNHLIPSLEELAIKLGFELDFDEGLINGIANTGFHFKRSEITISFVAECPLWKDFFFGLAAEKNKDVKQFKLNCLNKKSNEWWPWGYEYFSFYRNIWWNNEAFKDMVEGTYTLYIESCLNKILKELEEREKNEYQISST